MTTVEILIKCFLGLVLLVGAGSMIYQGFRGIRGEVAALRRERAAILQEIAKDEESSGGFDDVA